MNIFNHLKQIVKTGEFNKIIGCAKLLKQLNLHINNLNTSLADIALSKVNHQLLIERDIQDLGVRQLVSDRINKTEQNKVKPLKSTLSKLNQELDQQVKIFDELISNEASKYIDNPNKTFNYVPFCSRYGIVAHRKDMPQIDDCEQFLVDCNLSYKRGQVSVDQLKPTQIEIQSHKVLNMLYGFDKIIDREIIVSSDGYILDGHHFWATMLEVAPSYSINVLVVDVDILTLLQTANTYTKSKIEKALTITEVAYQSKIIDSPREFKYCNSTIDLIDRMISIDSDSLKRIRKSNLHFTFKNIANYIINGRNSR